MPSPRPWRSLPCEMVEDRVVAAGGVAAAVRTVDQWRSHPQGGRRWRPSRSSSHRSLGAARPRARRWGGSAGGGRPGPGSDPGHRRPGVHPLSRSPRCRCAAGRSAGPSRHAHGGQRRRPCWPSGARPSISQTTAGGSRDTARAVERGRRGGLRVPTRQGLDRFGLDPDDLAERHPGLVVVYLAAWGHSGPWAGRRGFDSVVQAPTGIAAAESPDGTTPGALPCNSSTTAPATWPRRRCWTGCGARPPKEARTCGGLSLARTAAWLLGLPRAEAAPVGSASADGDDRAWLTTLDSADGPVTTVRPPGQLDDEVLAWPRRLGRYGGDQPTWRLAPGHRHLDAE